MTDTTNENHKLLSKESNFSMKWNDMNTMMSTLSKNKSGKNSSNSKSVYGTSSIRTKNPDLDNPDIFYIKTRDGYFEEFNPEMIRKRCQQINKGGNDEDILSFRRLMTSLSNSAELKKIKSYGSFSPEELSLDKSNMSLTPTSLGSSTQNFGSNPDLSDRLIYGPDLNLPLSGLLKKVQDGMSNGISTEDIVTLTMNTAYASVKNEPKWDIFAGRCFMYNESKKLRNFSATERWKMCFHGTWPYMFSDFNIRREMGKTDSSVVNHKDPSLIISIIDKKDIYDFLIERLMAFQFRPMSDKIENDSSDIKSIPFVRKVDDYELSSYSNSDSDEESSDKSPTDTPITKTVNTPNNLKKDGETGNDGHYELKLLSDNIKVSSELLFKKILGRSNSYSNIKSHNKRIESLFSFSDVIHDRYNPKSDGPFFKQDNMEFHNIFSTLDWKWIPSTSSEFYDDAILLSSIGFKDDIHKVLNYCKKSLLSSTLNDSQIDLEETLTRINDWDTSSCKMRQPLSHLLLSSSLSRPQQTYDILVDRREFIKKNFPGDNGLLKYNNIIKNYDHIKDSTGRIVALHSILDYDFYYIVENWSQKLELMLSSIITLLHKNWSNSNSSYKSILGRFHYCFKTPATDRYTELPHEGILRCAINSVIGKLYDEFPEYMCYFDEQYLNPDEQHETVVIRNKSPLSPRDLSRKCFIDWGRFDTHMWDYFFTKVEEVAFALATEAVTLPTPTQKNSGSRNNQGTSCFLIHNVSDSIKGIYKTLELKEAGSRLGGGTATFFDIRAKGVAIKGINGIAAGTPPVSNLHAESTGYVTQSNNRNGATSNQTIVFNYDFMSMLLLKSTKQDLTKETSGRDVFFAAICNNFFMKKVKANEDVALFCLAECDKMFHTQPDQFEQMYYDMINLGYAKQIINAKTLLKKIAEASLKNGDPYCVSMDTANNLSMQIQRNENGDILSFDDIVNLYTQYKCGKFLSSAKLYELYEAYSIIRQTNLCTEVFQPTDSEKASGKIPAKHSACNLAATNVPFCLIEDQKGSRRLNGFILVSEYMVSELNGLIIKERPKQSNDTPFGGIFTDCVMKLSSLILSIKSREFKKKLIKMSRSDIVELVYSKLKSFVENPDLLKTNVMMILKQSLLSVKTYSVLSNSILKSGSMFDNVYSHKLVAISIFVVNFLSMVGTYYNFICSPSFNKKFKNIDFSMLFYSSWMATCCADSFVGYAHNISDIMHKYQQDYRSVIIGLCGLADLRIACEISYNDIMDSLEFEKSVMETVEFGGLMWSHFNRIVSSNTAYPRFIEGALHKNLYHHELYCKYYGKQSKTGTCLTKEIMMNNLPYIDRIVNEDFGNFQNTPKKQFKISDDGKTVTIPEMNLESGLWNWSEWKSSIKIYGVKNSTITGNMPTSNASNVSGFTPSIQPIQGIYALKDGKIAHTVEICWTAVMLLNKYGCWTNEVKSYIAKNKGSVSGCQMVPIYLQNILKTAYEIQPEILVIHDAVRGAFTCQSSSNNRYLAAEFSNTSKLTDLWLLGHELGLITLSYYVKTNEVIDSSNFSTGSAGLTKINTTATLNQKIEPKISNDIKKVKPEENNMINNSPITNIVTSSGSSWEDVIINSNNNIQSISICPESGCEGCGT